MLKESHKTSWLQFVTSSVGSTEICEIGALERRKQHILVHLKIAMSNGKLTMHFTLITLSLVKHGGSNIILTSFF